MRTHKVTQQCTLPVHASAFNMHWMHHILHFAKLLRHCMIRGCNGYWSAITNSIHVCWKRLHKYDSLELFRIHFDCLSSADKSALINIKNYDGRGSNNFQLSDIFKAIFASSIIYWAVLWAFCANALLIWAPLQWSATRAAQMHSGAVSHSLQRLARAQCRAHHSVTVIPSPSKRATVWVTFPFWRPTECCTDELVKMFFYYD
jgi:hypothetical protein